MITLLYSSYNYIDSGIATTLHFSYPVFVMILSFVLLKKKLGIKSVLCAVLALGGIFLLNNSSAEISAKGVLIAVASGFAYAFYIVLSEKLSIGELNVLVTAFWISLLSAIYLGCLLIFTGDRSLAFTPVSFMATVSLSVTAVLGLMFFQKGLEMCGGVKASLFSTFEPLTSVIVGVLIFGESLTMTNLIGAVLIIAASLFLVLS